ncbi:hypothetical protein [Kitasatospora purpeofusca]|uniref:hypothetical protein n=1 Tax=Kitasatospora purpeofusca TaxID=67352 RepID=UPI003F4AC166
MRPADPATSTNPQAHRIRSSFSEVTVDGKGVVMRPEALREATAKATAVKGGNAMRTRLASGEKLGRKRMATLAAVYDAEPAVRSVISDPDAGPGPVPEAERRPGPETRSKWLTRSVNDTAAEVVTPAFGQAEHRDPGHRRPWVVLLDGAGTSSTSSPPKPGATP